MSRHIEAWKSEGKVPDNPMQKVIADSVHGFLRAYNRLEIIESPHVPKRGPVIAAVNHSSLFDAGAMMVADPYRPRTTPFMKEQLSHVPGVKDALNLWGAIYVKRDGSDLFEVKRRIRQVLLEEKRGICIAVEGTRSTSGRMEGLQPSAVQILLEYAALGIPIIPSGIDGYDVLPKGSILPRPNKITVRIGDPLDLSPWAGRRVRTATIVEAAAAIQAGIVNLLPEKRRPLADSSPIKLSERRMQRGIR